MSPRKIAITFRQGLVRAAFRNIVTKAEGVEIAGEACNSVELLALLNDSVADLILLNIDIIKKRGMKMVEQIKALFPAIKIIITTTMRLTYLITFTENP